MASEGERENASFYAREKYSGIALLVYALIAIPLWYLDFATGGKSATFVEIMAILTLAFLVTLGMINWYVRKRFRFPK